MDAPRIPQTRPWLSLGAALALLISPVPASPDDAQQGDETVELEEVQVVAPPIVEGTVTDRYGGQKTVVSQLQIEDLNAQDLSSVLRTTPGVTITRYNVIGSFGGGAGGAVFIRGVGSSRPGGEIQTYIDGIPVYNPVWNHPLLDLLPLTPARSVEVYKGAQPASFANTFGAVNLVTKRRAEEGFETRAEAGYGRYDTFIESGEHGGKIDRLDYFVGQSYKRSHGHRKDADGRLADFFGRLGYQVSDNWDASVLLLGMDNYADDPGPRGRPDLKEGRYETRAFIAGITAHHRYEHAEGELKAYWNTGEGDWRDQAGVADNTLNDWDLYGLRGREALHLWEGGEVLLGADVDVIESSAKLTYDDATPTGHFDGPRFSIVSPHAAVSHLFGTRDGLHAVPGAGVRFSYHSDFDAAWSPHGSLAVGYGPTELHAAYARGVSYPGLNVVVFSEQVLTALGESWKDLDPEIVDHVEVGLSHEFGRTVKASLTLFHDDGSDRYIVVPPPPPPPAFENVEEFTLRGAEAGVTVFPVETLSLFGGATYLDPDPNDLPYAPRWTFSGGINWRFLKPFKLALDAQYVDEMHVGPQLRVGGAENDSRVDSYFLLNAVVTYSLDLSGLGLGGAQGELFVAGQNLADTDYEYQVGYPMPGVSWMLGARLRF